MMQGVEQQLEEVYRVAPVPEEYMKYQLHLNTGLEMDQIDKWFQERPSRQSTLPEKRTSGATVTTGMKGSAVWEKGPGGREARVSSGQPGLPDSAAAAGGPPYQPAADLAAGVSSERLRGGASPAEPMGPEGPNGRELMRPPKRLDEAAGGVGSSDGGGDSIQPSPCPEPSDASDLAALHPLDWLGEPNGQHSGQGSGQFRAGNGGIGDGGASASRQASGALIETIGHPSNAGFLLDFVDGGGPAAAGKEDGSKEEQPPGGFRLPASKAVPPPGYPSTSSASRPPSLGGNFNSRPSSSGRSIPMAPPPAHSAGSQQRASQGPAAALLDQFEGRGSGDKQVRDWYGDRGGSGGGNDQPGLAGGGGLSKSWRLQQWDIQGRQQPPYAAADTLMYSVPVQEPYPRHSKGSQQYEELERGQVLQRGTSSLPALPGHSYRQELLSGFPSHSHDGRRTTTAAATADLSAWRRPNFYATGSPQAFIPNPVQQNAPSGGATLQGQEVSVRVSEPTPLPSPLLMMQRDELGSGRRSGSGLPRSLSDISESQRFSGGGYLTEARSASDGATHASGDLSLPGDGGQAAAGSEARFVEADLECVAGLIGLQTITSVEEHEGLRQLFLFEQLTHLDSLSPDSGLVAAAGKRRRVRHQHFWRNSDKLPPEHRLYVTSADIKLALEQAEPVKPLRQITSAERTNMWTVCLTSQGVLGYLNRRVSPLGVRLFRAAQAQARAGGCGGGNAVGQRQPSLPALLLPKPRPAVPPEPPSAPKEAKDPPNSGKKRRTSLRRSQS